MKVMNRWCSITSKMIIIINSDESELFTKQQQQQHQIHKITREASITIRRLVETLINFAMNDANQMQLNHLHDNEKQLNRK